MEKLVSLHMAGELPKEGFGKFYLPLDQQVKQLAKALPELEAEIDFLSTTTLSSDYILQSATHLFDSWATMELPEKRQIIEEMISRVSVTADGITFKFAYNPTFLNSQHNGNESMPMRLL